MPTSASLFDASWYLQRNPDVAAAVALGLISAEDHFQNYGRYEGRAPGPLFNPNDYLAHNPDVAQAVEAGLISAYDHFIQYGAGESRSPISLFDPDFYLSQNPDVAAAVEAGLITATEHFLLYGQGEPRQINPFINLRAYLGANPDIAEAADQGTISPLTHLLTHGAAEGRDLGNGINLGVFANDPAFQQAVERGDLQGALERMEDVAPFLPSFEPPAGWEPAPDTPIPLDFTPPDGTKLVIPPSVIVPDDIELPDDIFEPVEPGPEPDPQPEPQPDPGPPDDSPDTSPLIVKQNAQGVVTFGGTGSGEIVMVVTDADEAIFMRDDFVSQTVISLKAGTSFKNISLAADQTLVISTNTLQSIVDATGIADKGIIAGSGLLILRGPAAHTSSVDADTFNAIFHADFAGTHVAQLTTVAEPASERAFPLQPFLNYALGNFENHVQLADLSGEDALAPQQVMGGSENDAFYATTSGVLMGGELAGTEPTAGLILDGGAGTDSLFAQIDSVGDPDTPTAIMPTIRNVEHFYLTPTIGAAGAALLFTRVSGATHITHYETVHNLTATDVRDQVTLGATRVGQNFPTGTDFAVRYHENVTHSGTQQLELNDANLNLLTITKLKYVPGEGEAPGGYTSQSAGIHTLSIVATGENSINSFEEPGTGEASLAASLNTIKVTGEAGSSLNLHALPQSVMTLDASQFNGTIAAGAGNTDTTLTLGAGATFQIIANTSDAAVITINNFDADTHVIDLTKISDLDLFDMRFLPTRRNDADNEWEHDDTSQHLGIWTNDKNPLILVTSAAKETLLFRIDEGDYNYTTMRVNIAEGGVINGGTDGELGEVLLGGDGSQTLNGGDNNDVLIGGKGADTLSGGAGADIFEQGYKDSVAMTNMTLNTGNRVNTNDKLTFGNGLDVITDFKPGAVGETDTLALQATSQLTSGFGVQPNALEANQAYYLSGDWNADNRTFTVAVENTGKDTLIIQGYEGEGQKILTNESLFLLLGVESRELSNENIV